MFIERFTRQPHLLSERPLSGHSLLHLLELLSLYIDYACAYLTYPLNIVDLDRVRGLDVTLLNEELSISNLFLLLFRLFSCTELAFKLLFSLVGVINERLLQVVFVGQVGGVP